MGTFKCFIVVLLFIFLLIPALLCAQVYEMSTQELTEESTSIHVGKCVEKASFWNDKHDRIFTKVKFTVEETIKGESVTETEVLVPGGRMGNIIYEVSDMPVFIEGEESLLFLWKNPSGKKIVTGALHGKRTIHKDKNTGQKMILDRKAKHEEDKEPHGKGLAKKRLLKDYVDEIKGYLKK